MVEPKFINKVERRRKAKLKGIIKHKDFVHRCHRVTLKNYHNFKYCNFSKFKVPLIGLVVMHRMKLERIKDLGLMTISLRDSKYALIGKGSDLFKATIQATPLSDW